MGIGFDSRFDSMAIAGTWQVWRMRDLLQGQAHESYDRLYGPRQSWATGDLDAHDISMGDDGQIVFANTLFSCLATVSADQSFEILWKPKFISKLAAEDRCHLNGLAMRDGTPAFVSCLSSTDVHEGWRDHKRDGGVVVDVGSGEIVCTGLSMPHSPRWHDGRLWIHNSGAGEFGYVDLDSGRFEAVCFCPGYLRGMSFVNGYALVGLSKARNERAFSGLALSERLEREQVQERCGVYVIDLQRGDIVQRIEFDGVLNELYDVVAMPGVRNPSAIGVVGQEAHYMLRFEDQETGA